MGSHRLRENSASRPSYAEKCFAAEDAVRATCPIGWQRSKAWVGVHFAEPKTEAERRALALFQERHPRGYMLHAYDIVELLADVIQSELDDHRESNR